MIQQGLPKEAGWERRLSGVTLGEVIKKEPICQPHYDDDDDGGDNDDDDDGDSC